MERSAVAGAGTRHDNDDDDVVTQSSNRSRGVQSVEVGIKLLRALAAARGPMSLRDLAAAAGMAPAKAHRYMASFVETGMVDHRRSGTYDLGKVAGEIGMAAVARVDLVNRAADKLPELVEKTNATGMLAVWATQGPIVLRWERARDPLGTILGVGTVLPVARSATGRAFLAYLPDRFVERVLAEEEPHANLSLSALRGQENDGVIFRSEEAAATGLYAIARPVLDYNGVATAVVTLFSHRRSLIADGGPAEAALRQFDASNGA
ncbi:MAG: helix-turn-helix domain-containing protein [Pseudomonadota bacterium]